MRRQMVAAILIAIFLAAIGADKKPAGRVYPTHKNITATMFWVGEASGPENGNIPNAQSAWDDKWQDHFGGVDDPENKLSFEPKENPFYFALPYNDFTEGHRREDAAKVIPWAGDRTWKDNESMCKNRWIKITHGEKACYAQWEDVGPFGENDVKYVFGDTAPSNKENQNAGLDLSPATTKFLGLSGMDAVDWQFVDDADVPEGPWKKIVTTSQIFWQ